MPRTKQVMKFVEDDTKRESTYKRRVRSLAKKTLQLGDLCSADILLIGVKPGTAGALFQCGMTTCPADRRAMNELVTRFRETPLEGIKENLNIGTYLQGELAKEQRKLVKVKQSGLDDVLTLWDSRLDDLDTDGFIALHHALGKRVESVQRRIAELSSVHNVPTSAVTVTAPALQHAAAFPGNLFELNLLDAGSSMGAQDRYYLPLQHAPTFAGNAFDRNLSDAAGFSIPTPALQNARAFPGNDLDFNLSNAAGFSIPTPALQNAPVFPGNDLELSLWDTGFSIGAQDHYYLPPGNAFDFDLSDAAGFSILTPALQHAPAFPGNALELSLWDTGFSVEEQDNYYPPPDILPQPVPAQSPYIGFQFHVDPPRITFGIPPMTFMPFQMAAPPGFSFTGGGINITDGLPAATAGFYDDFAVQGPGQGFAAGAAEQELQSANVSFDAAGTGAGAYELEPRAAGVWPPGTPNNPVDTAAYQLQDDTVLWPDNAVGHLALGEQEERSWLQGSDPWM